MSRKIVIIGASEAGISLAVQLRKENKDDAIMIIDRRESNFIFEWQNNAVQNFFIKEEGITNEESIQQFSAFYDISLELSKDIRGILTEKRQVEVYDSTLGKFTNIPYDILILAMKRKPFLPQVPGASESKNLYFPVALDNYDSFQQKVEKENIKEICIWGNDVLSLKTIHKLWQHDVPFNIRLITDGRQFLPSFDEEVRNKVLLYLKERNVKVLSQEKIQEMKNEGREWTLFSGEETTKIPCDLGFLAVEDELDISFVKKSGIVLGFERHIRVDKNFQTNILGIFAIGDTVESYHMQRKSTHTGDNKIFQRIQGEQLAKVLNDHLTPPLVNISMGSLQLGELFIAKMGVVASDLTYFSNQFKSMQYQQPICKEDTTRVNYLKILTTFTGDFLGIEGVGDETLMTCLSMLAPFVQYQGRLHDLNRLVLFDEMPGSYMLHEVAKLAIAKLDGKIHSFSTSILPKLLEKNQRFVKIGEENGYELPNTLTCTLENLVEVLNDFPKDEPVYLYSNFDNASEEACWYLKNRGYIPFYLEGGLAIYHEKELIEELGRVESFEDKIVDEAPVELEKEEMLIFISKNSLDSVLTPLNLALGQTDKNITVICHSLGANVLKDPNVHLKQKGLVYRLFKWALPKGANDLPLSTMNYGGIGAWLMKKSLKKNNLLEIGSLLNTLAEEKVELIADTESMQVFHMSKEELLPFAKEGKMSEVVKNHPKAKLLFF